MLAAMAAQPSQRPVRAPSDPRGSSRIRRRSIGCPVRTFVPSTAASSLRRCRVVGSDFVDVALVSGTSRFDA